MADVTDAPFRRLLAKYSAHKRTNGTVGGPDVMWTEFVSADGLLRATPEGRKKLMSDLIFNETERPIVAQLFTSHPEAMAAASRLCLELGFDGIDINMGCPDRSIEKQGAGAALMKNPEGATAVFEAAKQGAKTDQGGIPVSIKTRLGYYSDQLEEWATHLLALAPAALTIHARTRQEMSKVPAHWERLGQVLELRDKISPHTLVIGNGDVLSRADALLKAETYGVDGVMVGRALFGNPWFFHPTRCLPFQLHTLPTHGVDRETIISPQVVDALEVVSVEERLEVLLEHAHLFAELLPHKSFAVMKKHFKAYVTGFPGAVELRAELMKTNAASELEPLVHAFLQK